jgi:GDP-D-mannose 3',5'-epimerase
VVPARPAGKLRICITGAGGFIGSHLAKRLKSEGHYIVACDWKKQEYFKVCGSVCGHLFGRRE